jgi:hypothetical protein
MKQAALFFFACLLSVATFAQKATLTGQVNDARKQAVAGCSVLLSQKNGTAIKGSLTDSTGRFSIEATAGEYILAITATGFEKQETAAFVLKANETLTLPALTLAAAPQQLAGVTVTTRRKLFTMQADKLVMNVENSVLATGNTVFEVLRKAPAVTVDKDDNLKLKGAASQIFIDGRPAYLSGQQLTDYLKSLPADAVSTIEFITNPSSKYDAAGTAGIINIRLKKNQAFGLNGTASVGGGYGRYGKGNAGVNLNYRKNKINVFGNTYMGHSVSFNELLLNSTIRNNGTVIYQDRTNYWNPVSTYGSYKGGMDYSLSSKSTIGFLYRGYTDRTDARTDNQTIFSNSNRAVESLIRSVRNDRENDQNHFFNLNYKATLDTLGSELNLDADYAIYRRSATSMNENYFTDGKGNASRVPYLFRNIQPASGTIKAFKADYTRFLPHSLKLETGLKASRVNTDNDLQADSLSQQAWTKDYSRSNRFVYTEQIYAAYVNLACKFGKTQVQAGVRAEQTVSKGTSVTLNREDKRNYLNLFPTLFITRSLSENQELHFSYSRRISRPGYQNLNPFVTFVDPFTYFEGNPYLKPSYSNSFELKHSFKQAIFTSLSYRHSTDVQTNVVRQDKVTGITTSTTENANSSDYLRLDLTASLPLTKWWSSDNNAGMAYGRDYSAIPGFSYNTKAFSADFSTSNTFTLLAGFKVQTDFFYSIPTRDGIARIRSNYGWDLGVQKKVLNSRGTIKLNAYNLVGPSAFRSHLVSESLDINWRNQWEGKKVMISFIFRFGSSKIKASRSRNTASQQEQNRIN